ncbi:putative polysaccharide biosynthesis protein [Anaeromicropila herbilytica]|uniref:Stage V sporulation protein B n=1 Tax=Anaeromicropila herbilytica TaxID=2785025 RepID=A0A7R7ICW1_9FIRM|nr:polysaccharide biosynthesis protein [Anaeromicropila herbilytica]BCN30364.1 stage V sporulation protein B [Anaeromicropila herbilytica]
MAGKKKNSFLAQAGILAIVGIICRIIGVLYRSPLTQIIGDEGNGYYNTAYQIYATVLLISSYSIPSAISKVIAERLAMKEYRNAQKIFIAGIIYVTVVGGIASIITFIGSGWFVGKQSSMVLKVFAPTIFLSGILGVLRGYFQAHKTMMQTSVSQIIEQILNAVVSILAAYLLMSTVANADRTTKAVYGAIGSAIGTGSGVMIALIFMLFVYKMNQSFIKSRMEQDDTKYALPYKSIFKIIILMITPVILSTFLYNFNTFLNQTVYLKLYANLNNISSEKASTLYGIFSGKAIIIVNIPIAIAASISSAMIPTIAGMYAQGNLKATNIRIAEAIKTTMIIMIPSVVGLIVLAEPIVRLLFPQKESLMLAASLLRGLSITVLFYAISTISNAILQAIGKVNRPVINAGISLVIQTLVLIPLLIYTDLNLYCMVIVTIVYAILMCILNSISVRKELGYKQEIKQTFLMPILCALGMGVVAYLVYQGCYFLISINSISLMISIIFSAVTYFSLMILTHMIGREELLRFPKGIYLIRIAEKFRLLS